MKTRSQQLILLTLLLCTSYAGVAGVRVGISRKIITPQAPAWLSGYAARETPATGVLHDLWAKVMVIEENPTSRVIIVTTDLLGLSHEVSEDVSRQVIQKFGIDRSQLLLNSSHTHSGPMIWPALSGIADYSPKDQQVVAEYSHKLTADLVDAISAAMADLQPMNISYGSGSAAFAMNRRQPTAKGIINGVNPTGAVDHDVPVLKVSTLSGETKAILFGYACHNTTIQGNNFLINGDYAGFAQIELEKANPGATAMFIMGCAGDQNPYPRGTIALGEQHGKTLAGAVQTVLQGKLKPVNAPIRTSYVVTLLDFTPVPVSEYQKDVAGTNKFAQRRAKLMLEAYNKGWNVNQLPYPVQAIRFSKDFTIVALAGEVVVDYSLQLKKRYPNENLFVAGYSNEVMCYIPTKKVLEEGGYEAVDNLIYYMMPGPFAGNVEAKVNSAVQKALKKVGLPSKK